MKRKIFYVVIGTVRRLRDPYYQGIAAEMGFYFIFSVIPLLTLMVQLLSLFDMPDRIFESLLLHFAGSEPAFSLLYAVQEALGSSSLSIAFIMVTLWAASKIIYSMIRMANYTYRLDSGRKNGYVRSRARAVVTVMLLILMITATLVIYVYGNLLLSLFNMLLSGLTGIFITADRLLSVLRWPAALAVYWMFLAVMYKLLPGKRIPVKHTVPGSLFAAAGIMLVTGGYSVYLRYFSNLNVVYGSLGAVTALLLWFYLISYILVIGMVVNVSWFEDDEWQT